MSYGIVNAEETTIHGQFRINYYSLNQNDAVGPNTAAGRLRWRPTWDVKLPEDISMHMQLNIGHVEANTANVRTNQSGAPAVALRHAVLTFTTPGIGGKISAGLVPLSDKFGEADTSRIGAFGVGCHSINRRTKNEETICRSRDSIKKCFIEFLGGGV